VNRIASTGLHLLILRGHADASRYGDLSPLSGSDYFAQALSVRPPGSDTTFRVYHTPAQPRDGSNGILFVFHHGLGYSGLSFACAARELAALCRGECGFLALDCRGHGPYDSLALEETLIFGGRMTGKTEGEEQYSLTLDRMSNDLVDVLRELLPDRATAPKVLLVGHSMVRHWTATRSSLTRDRAGPLWWKRWPKCRPTLRTYSASLCLTSWRVRRLNTVRKPYLSLRRHCKRRPA
jgi:hypothetical protein